MTSDTARPDCAREIYRRRRELAALVASGQGRDPLLRSLTAPGAASADADDPSAHLACLAEAAATGLPVLFERHVAWTQLYLARHGAAEHRLARTLESMRVAIDRRMPAACGRVARSILERGLARLASPPVDPPSPVRGDDPSAARARAYLDALSAGDRVGAACLVRGGEARDDDGRASASALWPALREIGHRWLTGRMSVAEAHHAIEATRLLMARLAQHPASPRPAGPRAVAACLGGEHHEIGVQEVCDALVREGWRVDGPWAGCSAARLVAALRGSGSDVVLLSATMTASLRSVRDVVSEIRADSSLAGTRVVVGGLAFDAVPELWRAVGADACASSAADAVRVCASWAAQPVG